MHLANAFRAGMKIATIAIAFGIASDVDAQAPAPTRQLLGQPVSVQDRTFTPLDLDANALRTQEKASPDRFAWDEKGATLFVLENGGVLRKVSVPAFEELAVLKLEDEASQIQVCRSGLLVVMPKRGRIGLIDRTGLKVLWTIECENVSSLSSSPVARVALATVARRTRVLDLMARKFVQDFPAPEKKRDINSDRLCSGEVRFQNVGEIYHSIKLSPNGKDCVMVATGDAPERSGTALCRLDLVDNRLFYRASGFPVRSERGCWFLGNGEFVALEVQNFPDPKALGSRPTNGRAIHVFRAKDTADPVFVIPDAQAVAYDSAGGCFYAAVRKSLARYDSQGACTQEYAIPDNPMYNACAILPHPGGQGMLLQTHAHVYWVAVGNGAPAPAAAARKQPRQDPPPRPGTLTVQPCEADGCKRFELGVKPDQLAAMPAWSSDSRQAYVLLRDGTLTKLALGDGVSVKTSVSLESECQGLALSGEGLVTVLPKRQEALVLDHDSLDVTRRFQFFDGTELVTAPGLSVAYCISQDAREILAYDLARGAPAGRMADPRPDAIRSRSGGAFQRLYVTPDGKCLLTHELGAIHRCAIRGNSLVYQESTPRIAEGYVGRDAVLFKPLAISPDNSYVALPCGQQISMAADGKRFNGVYIFRLTSLQEPALRLVTDSYVAAVAFRPTLGQMVTFCLSPAGEPDLLTFDAQGAKIGAATTHTKDSGSLKGFCHDESGTWFGLKTSTEVALVRLASEQPPPTAAKTGKPPARDRVRAAPDTPAKAGKAQPKEWESASLVVEQTTAGSTKMTKLNLKGHQSPRHNSLAWSVDGSNLYALTADDALCRVDVKNSCLAAKSAVPPNLQQLLVCPLGPIIRSSSCDLSLFDPDTLQPKPMETPPKLRDIVVVPGTSTVIGATSANQPELVAYDLKTGRTLFCKPEAALQPDAGRPRSKASQTDAAVPFSLRKLISLAVTPDRKYLFGFADGFLYRFSLHLTTGSADCTYAGRTPDRALGDGALCVSADSHLVMAGPFRSGNEENVLRTYAVSDLSRPVSELSLDKTEGIWIDCVTDPHANLILLATGYAVSRARMGTRVYDSQGKPLPLLPDGTMEVLLHPRPGRLAAMTSYALFWVDWAVEPAAGNARDAAPEHGRR